MQRLLQRIERLYFNGDTRRGPRSAFIFKELQKRGCSPVRDRFGNIWVEKGAHFLPGQKGAPSPKAKRAGSPLALFSSHMDVDPRIFKSDLNRGESARNISGVLDNAVGCCLNILLAEAGPKNGSAIYIFTASEEISRGDRRTFARSAKKIVRILAQRKIKPDMCVAIDVTYPGLKTAHHRMDWGKKYPALFHLADKTHCYLDGYCTPSSRRKAFSIARKIGDKRVRVRDFPGHDEASVYCRVCPSFAFGPVVFGAFDAPGQSMPFSHAKTALATLKKMVR